VQPDSVTRHTHVTGIGLSLHRAVRKFPLEAEAVAIEVLRRRRV
jgi:hypothetical protein